MNDRTMHPLTDEQLLEWLDGAASAAVQEHLERCAPCRAEADALQDGISRYAIALRRQAAQAQSARLAGGSAPARAQHRLRWVGAGMLALLLAAQTVWMMKPWATPGASQSHAASPKPAVAAAPDSPQPAAMSDDELLQAVNNDLGSEVPQALAPVGTITVARNRIASEVERQKLNAK